LVGRIAERVLHTELALAWPGAESEQGDSGIQAPSLLRRDWLKNLCIPDRAKKPKARV
jgi:hypothetical protein